MTYIYTYIKNIIKLHYDLSDGEVHLELNVREFKTTKYIVATNV